MRDYFYLSQLENSGYNIGVADAIHLGASFKLPIYIYLAGSAYFTDGEGEKVFRGNDLYLRLGPGELKRIEKTYIDSTIRSPAQADHLKEFFSVSTGIVDERYRGARAVPIMPHLLALMENWGGSVQVHDKDGVPINGRIGELICYTDDLKKVTEPGSKQQEEVKQSDASADRQDYSPQLEAMPDDFSALYNAMGAGELPHMDTLITAWRRYWKERTPNDGKPYPVNADVADWVKKQMESPSTVLAENMAKIIRPSWAPLGRQSNRNQ